MSDFDPLNYWEQRHVELAGDHRNVGNKGLTSEQNRELIVAKSAIVAHVLGTHQIPRAARILDAGCGAGAFTEILQMAGFRMTGVDGSPSAITEAQANRGGAYAAVPLSAIDTDDPFDAVLCLDVLFHVVVDEEWQKSLRALCAAVSNHGLLIIIETFGRRSVATPQHVRWRSRQEYETALSRMGFSVKDEFQFQYPHEGTDKTLLVCSR